MVTIASPTEVDEDAAGTATQPEPKLNLEADCSSSVTCITFSKSGVEAAGSRRGVCHPIRMS